MAFDVKFNEGSASFKTSFASYVEGSGGGSTSKYTQPEWGVEANGVILAETTLEVDAESGGAMLLSPLNATIADGKVYTVGFNGTFYQCTAVANNELKSHLLGNGAVLGLEAPGDDAPFFIVVTFEEEVLSYGYYAVVIPLDGSASCTVSIMGETMHKIPQDYVEGSGYFVVLVDVLADGTVSFSHSFDEVLAAIKSGKQVYARHETVYCAVSSWIEGAIWFTSLSLHDYILNVQSIVYQSNGNNERKVWSVEGTLLNV